MISPDALEKGTKGNWISLRYQLPSIAKAPT
jgi:hypothetical protein